MARPEKNGLDYFPFDVDFFDDLKVRKLIRRQGGKAALVYIVLLCLIYRNGYYIGSDNDLPFIISEKLGYDEEFIQEALKNLFALDLITKAAHDGREIYTSKGIQYRYTQVQKLSKRRCAILAHLSLIVPETVVSSEETRVNSEETRVNSEETPVSSEVMQQTKQKKSKVKTTDDSARGRASPPAGRRPSSFFEFENFVLSNKYPLDAKTEWGKLENKKWTDGEGHPIRNWHSYLHGAAEVQAREKNAREDVLRQRRELARQWACEYAHASWNNDGNEETALRDKARAEGVEWHEIERLAEPYFEAFRLAEKQESQ